MTDEGNLIFFRKNGERPTYNLDCKIIFKVKSDALTISDSGGNSVGLRVHLKMKMSPRDRPTRANAMLYIGFVNLGEFESFLGGVLLTCPDHNVMGLFHDVEMKRLVARAVSEPKWQVGDGQGESVTEDQVALEVLESAEEKRKNMNMLNRVQEGISKGFRTVGKPVLGGKQSNPKHDDNSKAGIRGTTGFVRHSLKATFRSHVFEAEIYSNEEWNKCVIEIEGSHINVSTTGINAAVRQYSLHHLNVLQETGVPGRTSALRAYVEDTSIIVCMGSREDLRDFLVTLSAASDVNNIMGFLVDSGLGSEFGLEDDDDEDDMEDVVGVRGRLDSDFSVGGRSLGLGREDSPNSAARARTASQDDGSSVNSFNDSSSPSAIALAKGSGLLRAGENLGLGAVSGGLMNISSSLQDLGGLKQCEYNGVGISFCEDDVDEELMFDECRDDGQPLVLSQRTFSNTDIEGMSLETRLEACKGTKSLDLSGWSLLGDVDVAHLQDEAKRAPAMEENATERPDLSSLDEVAQVRMWLQSEQNVTCRKISLKDCHLDGAKFAELTKQGLATWTCKKLRSLDLSMNPIRGMASVQNALQNEFRYLRNLDLAGCSTMGCKGVDHISFALASRNPFQCPLESLVLRHCGINKLSAINLAMALRDNTVLKSIDLSSNFLGPQGACELARGLISNNTLETLNVNSQMMKIGPEGAIQLSRLLRIKSSGLRVLRVAHNDIGFEGCRHLAGALLVNTSLYELDMGGINYITMGGARQLGQAIVHNVTLEWLMVGAHRLPLSILKSRELINEYSLGTKIRPPPHVLDLTDDIYNADEYGVSYSAMDDETAIVIATCLQGNMTSEREFRLRFLKLNTCFLDIRRLTGGASMRESASEKTGWNTISPWENEEHTSEHDMKKTQEAEHEELDLRNKAFNGMDAIIIGALLTFNKRCRLLKLEGNFFAQSEGENWIALALDANPEMLLDYYGWPAEQMFIDGYKTLASMRGFSASGARIEPQRLEGCFYVFLTMFASFSFYLGVGLDINAIVEMEMHPEYYENNWVILYAIIICLPTMLMLRPSIRLLLQSPRQGLVETASVIFQLTSYTTTRDACKANMETTAYLDHKYVNGIYRSVPLIMLQFYIIFSVFERERETDEERSVLDVILATVLSLFGVTVIFIMIYDRKEARLYSLSPRSNQPAVAIWLADWLEYFGMGATHSDEEAEQFSGLDAFVNFDAFYTSHYVWSWIYQFLSLTARIVPLSWTFATVNKSDPDGLSGTLLCVYLIGVRSLFILFLEPSKSGEHKSKPHALWNRFFKPSNDNQMISKMIAPTLQAAAKRRSAIREGSGLQGVSEATFLPELLSLINHIVLPVLAMMDVLVTLGTHAFDLAVSDSAMYRNDHNPNHCLNIMQCLVAWTSFENFMVITYMTFGFGFTESATSLPDGACHALFSMTVVCIVLRAVLFRHWLRYVHFQSIFSQMASEDQMEAIVSSARHGKDESEGEVGPGRRHMRRRSAEIEYLSYTKSRSALGGHAATESEDNGAGISPVTSLRRCSVGGGGKALRRGSMAKYAPLNL